MATTEDALSMTGATPTTDAQWMQWALSVFGGNHVRASAAASAAAAARSAGASSDELFSAAQAAYNNPPAAAVAARVETADVAFAATNNRVLRPTGRSALGLAVAGILLAGIVDVLARFHSEYVAPVILVFALVLGVWFALTLRCSVRIVGTQVVVQGLLHRRVLSRIDIRQITIQPRSRQLGQLGATKSPLRGQFLASFVGDDFSHLFELRQGAWSRADIARIGAAIGVDVVDDPTPSIT